MKTDLLVYAAPMEGITTYPFRNLHQELFGGADKYFTPFLSPVKQERNVRFAFKKRDLRDVLPEHNASFLPFCKQTQTSETPPAVLVPQILANRADAFLWAVRTLADFGYREVNLNLGCPVATVVNKHKGAGFLADPDALDAFFEEVFQGLGQDGLSGGQIAISVKTRLGVADEAEALPLMRIFNRYPLSEVIIHARLKSDFYSGAPRLQTFFEAAKSSAHPVGYNGEIRFAADCHALQRAAAQISDDVLPFSSVMLGRFGIANPALARHLKGGTALTKQELASFMERLYEETARVIPETNNVVRHLKAVWDYVGQSFTDCDRAILNLRKARSKTDYDNAVRDVFRLGTLRQSDFFSAPWSAL